jgi:16S rRNA (uracil1498-N3)-methyltransferase
MRRIHLEGLVLGAINLPEKQAHYLRDVLRLTEGSPLEAFDASGKVGRARLVSVGIGGVTVFVDQIEHAAAQRLKLTIASAIPKGTRADWMIEKLSELGVHAFIPLIATRSVVIPRESNKSDRWTRLASEASRQSGRNDVMAIEPALEVAKLIEEAWKGERTIWYLSTRQDATPLVMEAGGVGPAVTLLIGPEGGWTPEEIAAFEVAGLPGLRLTPTVLRVETAAVAAAAVMCCLIQ